MAKKQTKYDKPHLSLIGQIKQLEKRGMEISDHDQGTHHPQHLNYHLLGVSWLPFEANHATHDFLPDTRFEAVLDLYEFDRELRLLVMDAIERIEVSIRTQFAYHLSYCYGSHAHLKTELFTNPLTYASSVLSLETSVQQSKEPFIKHLKKKYEELLPPIWASVELLTLGQLSKWYSNLAKRADRKIIADSYDLDQSVLQSFLHQLTIIRNICAHHSRLWNRPFPIKTAIPKTRPASLSDSFNLKATDRLYNAIVLMTWMMDTISPGHSWKSRLLALLEKHDVETTKMGFPPDYKKLPVWT